MPEKITIRERIERRLQALAAAMTDIVAAHRRDWIGPEDVKDLEAYIMTDGEDAEEDGMGTDADATTTYSFDAAIAVCIMPTVAEQTSDPLATVYNRWLGRIKEAYTDDPDLTDDDASTQQLSNAGGGVRITGSNDPPTGDDAGCFFVIVLITVPYTEYRNDPYAGPGVTARTV